MITILVSNHLHREVCQQLPDTQRSQLGQYMTSAAIARFMASLFHYPEQARLLDAGAGTGSLTAAFLNAALPPVSAPQWTHGKSTPPCAVTCKPRWNNMCNAGKGASLLSYILLISSKTPVLQHKQVSA